MGPAIEVEDLRKRYGARTVVDGISFAVEPGSLLCVLGRNGAGKTTTIECVEGFRTPDGGRVRILGCDPVAQRPQIAPRIGVMLQEGGAYQAATAREMLRLYVRLFPNPRTVDEALAATGLQDRADDRFRTLSGGEKQRLNLALALVGRPEVLFLDEPTAGMDPSARRDTENLVAQLRGEGAAILLTTHSLQEAERLADRIAILHHGRLLAVDTPDGIAGSASSVEVTCAAPVDVGALAAAFDTVAERTAPDRYTLGVGPERVADVAAWFARHNLPVTGIQQVRRSLEDAFFALTGDEQ